MPRYLISFEAHAMDHIPDEDMPAVTNASLAMVVMSSVIGSVRQSPSGSRLPG